jgi:hypothetical protein
MTQQTCRSILSNRCFTSAIGSGFDFQAVLLRQRSRKYKVVHFVAYLPRFDIVTCTLWLASEATREVT